ncbi:MAG: HlyD family efflux transporter periplasmic adaptor subunit [Bacteroidales bacterium]|jgi:HlyD family secretion protein|nr:HlyD family efflux transporter periplasmic adaptor subunit [Bacteroidales bacterium]
MKNSILIILTAILAASCSNTVEEADAYGNFEVIDVTVSSETAGRVLDVFVTEGSVVAEGEKIALIDTTMLHLQKNEVDAGMRSITTRISSINAQNAILSQQISNLEVNIRRIANMLKDDAATQKQHDDLLGQVAVLEKQIEANNTQKASVAAELSVLGSKKRILEEQIARSYVISPATGTVLDRYIEKGELTAAGKPLVRIADLTVIKLKVYVSGATLGSVKTGQSCTVRIDDGEKGYRSFDGTVTHIADKAEFTPKIIQTKEERVTLVYAVTIDVKNDGSMKSGMPGEALFQ